uniref:EF-hand domain-containing protein n=1 Tax=Haptolina ericina TaxID=156174 RepID=A0A7S3BLK0_9EUKA|mmetsp:Transcript_63097/g.140591  ORF Transcript_63097/g.140591 Transcript_63097/m.140591 type:complete len:283 (+) Transcript_63097:15-863(+)
MAVVWRSVLVLVLAESALAVEQGVAPNGMPEPPPLSKTLLQVFDKDHSGGVTLQEALTTMDGLMMMMGGMGGGAPGQPSAGPNEMEKLVKVAKQAAPKLFKLLDYDSSGKLEESELVWVEKALNAAKAGVFKDLTRELFFAIDYNMDDSLSPEELKAAVEPELFSMLIALVQKHFPLPGLTAAGSQAVAKENLQDIVEMLDGNGDGEITKKEAGAAVGSFKRAFVKAAESLQTMGPMLAMFGGMGGDMGGMGGMGAMGGMGGMGGGRGRGASAGRGAQRRRA